MGVLGLKMGASMSPIIRLESLSLGYDRHGQAIVQSASGQFEAGSMTAIVGPNGAGKTTLLKALLGELPPQSGTLWVAPQVRNHIGILPQLSNDDTQFPICVHDFVAMGALSRSGWWGAFKAQKAVQQALQQVGLLPHQHLLMGALSGGQRQRALFARLIVQDPQVIILDEPFSAVDEATTQSLMQWLQQWHTKGRTIIAVLHDIARVRQYFAQTLLLAREIVAWGPTHQVLTPSHLDKARHLALQGF